MNTKFISVIAILSLLAFSTAIVVNAQSSVTVSYIKFQTAYRICLPTGCQYGTASNSSIGISLDGGHIYTVKHTNQYGVLKIHVLPNTLVYYWACDPNSPVNEQCPSQATFGTVTSGANGTTVLVECTLGSNQYCQTQ